MGANWTWTLLTRIVVLNNSTEAYKTIRKLLNETFAANWEFWTAQWPRFTMCARKDNMAIKRRVRCTKRLRTLDTHFLTTSLPAKACCACRRELTCWWVSLAHSGASIGSFLDSYTPSDGVKIPNQRLSANDWKHPQPCSKETRKVKINTNNSSKFEKLKKRKKAKYLLRSYFNLTAFNKQLYQRAAFLLVMTTLTDFRWKSQVLPFRILSDLQTTATSCILFHLTVKTPPT